MEKWDEVKPFWRYIEFYPESDEDSYDGIHDGGIKGLTDDAPDSAKEAFKKYLNKQAELKSQGIKN